MKDLNGLRLLIRGGLLHSLSRWLILRCAARMRRRSFSNNWSSSIWRRDLDSCLCRVCYFGHCCTCIAGVLEFGQHLHLLKSATLICGCRACISLHRVVRVLRLVELIDLASCLRLGRQLLLFRSSWLLGHLFLFLTHVEY